MFGLASGQQSWMLQRLSHGIRRRMLVLFSVHRGSFSLRLTALPQLVKLLIRSSRKTLAYEVIQQLNLLSVYLPRKPESSPNSSG